MTAWRARAEVVRGGGTSRLTTTDADAVWQAGSVGLYRASGGITTTIEWDDFKCGLDINADGDIGDAGTDFVYADYNFNDPGGSTWQTITLSHDDTLDTAAPRQGQAGNLTNDGLFQYTYDAWNRLVGAWYAGGDVADADQRVARYEYDGLFRRVEKQTANRGSWFVHGSTAGGADGIVDGSIHQHYYYAGWRLVEMTTGTDTLGQWVWGVQYIDEAVVYDRNTDYTSDNDCLDAGSARYTYAQDANFRVVALTDEGGAIVERYEYTAYGEPQLLNGVGGGSLEFGNATFVSSVGNPFMHQGLFRDSEIGGYHNRFREYNSRVGRFLQQDPSGYSGTANLYEYLSSHGFSDDAFGLQDSQPATTQPAATQPASKKKPGKLPPCDKKTNYDRDQTDKIVNPENDSDISGDLDRGCLGLCMIYQANGEETTLPPESRPGTTCYFSQKEAEEECPECPPGKEKFVFSKQAQHYKDRRLPIKNPKKGDPEHDPTRPPGSIPTDSVPSDLPLGFNYVVVYESGGKKCYAWMNHEGRANLREQQRMTVDSRPPSPEDYQDHMWCVTCR